MKLKINKYTGCVFTTNFNHTIWYLGKLRSLVPKYIIATNDGLLPCLFAIGSCIFLCSFFFDSLCLATFSSICLLLFSGSSSLSSSPSNLLSNTFLCLSQCSSALQCIRCVTRRREFLDPHQHLPVHSAMSHSIML